MGDYWENIKAWFQGRQAKKRKEEEAVADVKLSMNDGDHGAIFGFNRNIIFGVFLAACAITAIAIFWATDDPSEGDKTTQQRPQQAAPANAGKSATNQYPIGYEELSKAETQYNKRNESQQGRGNGTPSASQQTQPRVPVAPASVPSVPQTAQTPVVVSASSQSEEDKEWATYMQRMKAPIAFSVSTGSAGSVQAQDGAVETNRLGDSREENAAPFDGAPSSSSRYAESAATAAYVAPGKYLLQAGTIIPVVLCTGINSDVGGQVVAQVQQDLYDTATGRNLLIPAGSKILGTYGKGSPNNSGRVEITFTSIVLPDGGSFSVGNSLVAIDGAGYSGISGKVDRHTASSLSAGMFSSALAALGSVAAGNTSNTSNTYSAGQLAMQGAMANVMNAASQLFQQGANQQMTVTAKPGTMFSIYVAQGLTLQRRAG